MDLQNKINPPFFFQQSFLTKLAPPCSFQNKLNPQSPNLICPAMLVMKDDITKNRSSLENKYNQKDDKINQDRVFKENLPTKTSSSRSKLDERLEEKNEDVVEGERERRRRQDVEDGQRLMEMMRIEMKECRKRQDATEEENNVLKDKLKRVQDKLRVSEDNVVMMTEKCKCWEVKMEVMEEKLLLMKEKYETVNDKLEETQSKLEGVQGELTHVTTSSLQQSTETELKLTQSHLKAQTTLYQLQERHDEEMKKSERRMEMVKMVTLQKELDLLKDKLSVSQQLQCIQEKEIQRHGFHKGAAEVLNRWRCRLFNVMIQQKCTQLIQQKQHGVLQQQMTGLKEENEMLREKLSVLLKQSQLSEKELDLLKHTSNAR